MDIRNITEKHGGQQVRLSDRIRFLMSRKLSYFLLYNHFKGAMLLRKRLCNWLVPPAAGPTVCSTLFDVDILVDPVADDGVDRSIYYFGEYEAGTLSVFRKYLHEGDIFLDVGAYIGFLSLAAARFVGRSGLVYAVEPHPFNYKILRENVLLNGFKNVCLMNIALGKETSEARIYDRPSINRGSASLICPLNMSLKSGSTVRLTTIDTLIEQGQVQLPDLIKIDVEGFELEVLKGTRALLAGPKAPWLCIECSELHPIYGGSLHDIYDLIKSINDYSFFKLKHGKGIPSKLVRISNEKELPYHDNIFCFLDRHFNGI